MISLTDAGHSMLQAAAPRHVRSVREQFIDLLAPEEIDCLATISDKVFRHGMRSDNGGNVVQLIASGPRLPPVLTDAPPSRQPTPSPPPPRSSGNGTRRTLAGSTGLPGGHFRVAPNAEIRRS